MRYVIDHSVLLEIVRGNGTVIEVLGLYSKREVTVPEPVLLHVAREVADGASPEAKERWEMLAPALPRAPWTADVTEKLLLLEPPAGVPVSLDAITAAHALASERAVLTVERARFDGMPGVRIEEIAY